MRLPGRRAAADGPAVDDAVVDDAAVARPGVARPGDHRLVLAAALAWPATRGLVVWVLLGAQSWVTGDLDYFAHSLTTLPEAGLGRTLVEYPLPGVLVVAVPWLAVELVGAPQAYAEAVLVFSLLADAAFMALLGRFGGAGRGTALMVWVLAVPLLGATAYARFDLVPGLLAGTALLLLLPHPRVAAAAGSLATGFKLWPALVLPALAAPASSRRAVVTVVGGLGAVLAGTSVALAGWSRLVSPLTWQQERGLQVESVAATPAMVGWALSPERYEIAYTRHNAYEITGPGVHGLLTAAEVLSLLLVPALVALWIVAFRHGRTLRADTVAWLALAAVAAFMVTSKVLSPQYLLWLLPLAAAAPALTSSRALRSWTAVLLAATATTQLVFPMLYGHLLTHDDLSRGTVLALVTRNALLLWLVVRAATHAVRGVSRAAGEGPGRVSGAGRWSASLRGRRGRTPAASADGPTTPR